MSPSGLAKKKDVKRGGNLWSRFKIKTSTDLFNVRHGHFLHRSQATPTVAATAAMAEGKKKKKRRNKSVRKQTVVDRRKITTMSIN